MQKARRETPALELFMHGAWEGRRAALRHAAARTWRSSGPTWDPMEKARMPVPSLAGLGSGARPLLSPELCRSGELPGTGEQTAAGTQHGQHATALEHSLIQTGSGQRLSPGTPLTRRELLTAFVPEIKREGTKRTKADNMVGILRTYSPLQWQQQRKSFFQNE